MHERVRSILDKLLAAFQNGDIPEAIAKTVIPRSKDIPCASWSLTNRLILFFSGTFDARGFRQWQAVGRYPRKGSKAIHILVPSHRKKENEETGEEELVLIGFATAPVFAYEQTDGEDLDIVDVTPQQLPPLHEVAEWWGISVKYQEFQGEALGSFQPQRNTILLATLKHQTFFHELAHAAHGKIIKLKNGQHWRQEVVAELTAAVLAKLYDEQPNTGASYQYIERYAQKAGLDVYKACLSVLSDTERCLKLIFEEEKSVLLAA